MASVSASSPLLSGVAANGSGVRVASAIYAVVFTKKLRRQHTEMRRLAGRYNLSGHSIPHARYVDDPDAAWPPTTSPAGASAGLYRLHTDNFSRITLDSSELSITQTVWKAVSDRIGSVLRSKPTQFWRQPTRRERELHATLKARFRLPSGPTILSSQPYSTRASPEPAGDHSSWNRWPLEPVPADLVPVETPHAGHAEPLWAIASHLTGHALPRIHHRNNSDFSMSSSQVMGLSSRSNSPGFRCNDCSCSDGCPCFATCAARRALHPETPPRRSQTPSQSSSVEAQCARTMLSDTDFDLHPANEIADRDNPRTHARVLREVYASGAWSFPA